MKELRSNRFALDVDACVDSEILIRAYGEARLEVLLQSNGIEGMNGFICDVWVNSENKR